MWFLWLRRIINAFKLYFCSLLQACLLGCLALSRTWLLQQLHRLQQDRRFRLYTRVSSAIYSMHVAVKITRQ